MDAGWEVRRALFGALCLAGAIAHADDRVDRMMASSVCVVGEVPGGSFESSGFVVEPGNAVVTTAHGVGAATNLRIKLRDGRIFPARLQRLGNENADIALLDVAEAKLPPVRFGSIREIRSGEEVVTIGCPLGFEFTLSRGVVSSLRDSDLGYPLIQTDVSVNPGSSGGPLFDSRGRVVGIIKSSAAGRERIHFALPADLATALLEQIAHEREAFALFNQAVLEPKVENKVALYRKVVSLDSSRFEAHYNLGLALERTGHGSEAETEYREALRLHPSYTPAALNLGALLYGEKRYREAIEVYRQAVAAEPRSVAARNDLAEAYRAAGNRDDARREFDAVLKQNPDYAPAHYGLAVLYDEPRGDRRRAAEHYRRYLALAPEAPDAAQVREWLRAAETNR